MDGGCNHVTLASSAARIRSPTHEWLPTLPSRLQATHFGQATPECPVTGVEPIVFRNICFPAYNISPVQDRIWASFFILVKWVLLYISLLCEIQAFPFPYLQPCPMGPQQAMNLNLPLKTLLESLVFPLLFS